MNFQSRGSPSSGSERMATSPSTSSTSGLPEGLNSVYEDSVPKSEKTPTVAISEPSEDPLLEHALAMPIPRSKSQYSNPSKQQTFKFVQINLNVNMQVKI